MTLRVWVFLTVQWDPLESFEEMNDVIRLFLIGIVWWASSKEPTCQCRRHKRCRFDPWVRKTPWRRKGQPTPVSLPGESHGQRNLAGYSPWGHEESDTATKVT